MSLYMIKCISLIVLIPLFLISKKSKSFWIEIAKYNVLIEIDTLKVINKFENDSIDILIKPLDRSGNLVLEKFNKKTNSIEWSKRFCASDSIVTRRLLYPDLGKDPYGTDGVFVERTFKCIVPYECGPAL